MTISINEAARITEVWLTNAECQNPLLQERLKPFYDHCRKSGRPAVVFLSGRQDLYQSTRDLLSYNRKRLAALDVQNEKQSAAVQPARRQ